MSLTRVALITVTIAIAVAGCGGRTPARQAIASPTGKPAVATTLDGLYLAALDRRAVARIRPRVHLPGGWWTLLIDSQSHQLLLSHPNLGSFTERLTAVDESEIRLAPSVSCEQPGPGRTQPSRLAWSASATRFRFRSIDVPSLTSGTYLRFQPIDVPCLTTDVLLTSPIWHKD